jgi:hypothetical protein
MRRPQFSLKSLLWLMACVACLCGTRALGIKQERAHYIKDIAAKRKKSLEATARLEAELREELLQMKQEREKETRDFRIWQALQGIPKPPQ